MNYDKLTSKGFLEGLDKQVAEEKLSELPEGLIQLLNNETINHCLSRKVGTKGNPTARVLNNWIKIGLIQINEADKGKIKRFGVLESIWLNILVEMRGFGVPIDSIKRTRKLLFNYQINNFSLFKFYILNNILIEPQTLVVFKDGGARILSTNIYLKNLKKGWLLPHLSFKLSDFIKTEYKNHSLDKSLNLSNIYDNTQKMVLLFFLRTGDFKNMKIEISDGDIRYFDSINAVLKNKDILQAIEEWKFLKIIISIDSDTET